MKIIFNGFLILLFLSLALVSNAANRYWIATTTANWNSTSNWSTTSGGSGGASVPSTSDIAIFDGNGSGRCDINANASVLHFDIRATYSDTIVQQSSRTITTGGSFHLSGGVFVGGNSNINLGSGFILDSNAFYINTSATLNVRGIITIEDGDDFNHNTGNLILTSGTGGTPVTLDLDTIVLYNFYVNNANGNKSVTFGSDNEITVNNDFKLYGSTTNYEIVLFGGKIFLKGDVYVEYFRTNSYGQGTTEIIFDGSGNQKIDALSNGAGGSLFKVTINKASSDTLFLYGKFRQDNNWDYNSGFVKADTSSRISFFRGSTISGTMTFHKVRFQNLGSSFTWNITDTITVNNTMDFLGDNVIYLLGGEIHCKGNFSVSSNTSSNISGAYIGNTKIFLDGTGDQSWIGKSTYSSTFLPDIIIDKSSGTLDITDHVTIGKRLHYIQGTIDYNSSTISVIKDCDITGNDFELYNFSIAALTLSSTNSAIGLNDSTFLTVNGTLTFNNSATSSVVYLASGTIAAKGNIEIINDLGIDANNGTILINGTGNQTIDGGSTFSAGNLPNITINKSSGTLYLKDYINVCGNWKYLSGNIDYSTNSNTLVMRTTLQPKIIGSHSIGNFYIYRLISSGSKTLTISNSTTLSVNGDFTTNGTSLFVIDSGTIEVKGNIGVTSGLNGGTSHIIAIGSNNQAFTGTTAIATGELPNFTIDKTGGTFTVTNYINIVKTLTLTNGIIHTANSSSKLYLYGTSSVSGGSKNSYVDGIVGKYGNTALTFPVGENGLYRPISFPSHASLSSQFEIEYFSTGQTLGTSFDTAFAEISQTEYWKLNRVAQTNTVKVTMSWSENKAEIPGDSATLGSLYWNSTTSKWVGINNDLITGSASEGSLRTVTLGTFTYLLLGKKKTKNIYAQTKLKLDGGFYLTKNNRLHVKYVGQYNASQFRFNIYTENNTIIANENSVGIVDRYYSKEGDNRFTFNFSSTSGYSIPDGRYILEIINDKNEKEYLRFEKL